MSYDEAVEATVTRLEAFAEIEKHGCDPIDFVEDEGNQETYPGHVVLGWLGY